MNCLAWLAKHSGTFHREMSVDGMTAVHAAALEGHLGCLVFLLSSTGCSALARDRTANTPLHYGIILILYNKIIDKSPIL